MDYRIEHKYGHVEVRDSAGRFVCSADTTFEAMQEINECLKAMEGCADEKAG